MNGSLVGALAVLACSIALAGDSPPTETASDASVDDLAHYFLSTPDASSRIKGSVVSDDGVRKLKEANATHWAAAHSDRDMAVAARRLCTDLLNARNGAEFAAALIKSDKAERERTRQAARRTLAELDPQDRQELENWLQTEFRRGLKGSGLGSRMTESFASSPFPSEATEGATREACNAATEYERRAKP